MMFRIHRHLNVIPYYPAAPALHRSRIRIRLGDLLARRLLQPGFIIFRRRSSSLSFPIFS